MTCYLDVGASQIQSWLGRTGDLRGRRGASTLLSDVTSAAHWRPRLPAGCAWNDEGGDVDGVVTLQVDDGQAAERVAREVLRHLRQRLPQLLLEASWASAPSYVEAYAELGARRDRGDGLSSVPTGGEALLARPCETCLAAPASTTFQLPSKLAQVCQDCACRYDAAGDNRRRASGVQRVLDDLEAEVGHGLTVAGDLSALARVGHRDTDDAPTRLAVVYADGNAVGAFIRAAAHASGPGVPAKSEIAGVLDAATRRAFSAAAAQARDGASLGVVPHLVGGDDVLASVTARYASVFVTTLLSTFDTGLTALVRGWPEQVRAQVPSLSASVVLHHRSSPLSRCIDLAAADLAETKRRHTGAAVCLLDLDQDDPAAEPRASRPATWVLAAREGLELLATQSSSLRQTLRDASRRPSAHALDEVREVLRKHDLSRMLGMLGVADGAGVADLAFALQLTRDAAGSVTQVSA